MNNTDTLRRAAEHLDWLSTAIMSDEAATLAASLRAMADEGERAKPVAWAWFSPNGNIRMWSTDIEEVRLAAANYGGVLTPLYAAPTTDAALRAENERLRAVLLRIGDYAHDHSTWPAVPDVLWEIRRMAYESEDAAIDAARGAGEGAAGVNLPAKDHHEDR